MDGYVGGKEGRKRREENWMFIYRYPKVLRVLSG